MDSIDIAEHWIDAPNGKIYAKSWSPAAPATNQPLVLLHDSLGCVDLWKDFPDRLATALSRNVIAYDRLGFGESDARTALPSLSFIEEEATLYFPAVKKALHLQDYVLLGHSVGGGMAINIAAQDPDCQAVITISAQAFVEDLTVKGIQDAKQLFAQPGQLARLEKWHGAKAEWVLHAWTDVWLADAFAGWNLASALAKVHCPVLAIHGEQDEYGSRAFPEFISQKAGGSAQMLLFENCGHMPHKEKPNEVIEAVRKFLGVRK